MSLILLILCIYIIVKSCSVLYDQFDPYSDVPLFEYRTDEEKTYTYCKKMLKKQAARLNQVPWEHRDYALCKSAIQKSCAHLMDVPDNIIDRELLIMTIDGKYYGEHTLHPIYCAPKALLTYDMYELAVRNDKTAMLALPKGSMYRKLCTQRITKNSYDLEYVPSHFLDIEMMKLAIADRSPSIIADILDRVPPHRLLAINAQFYLSPEVLERLTKRTPCI